MKLIGLIVALGLLSWCTGCEPGTTPACIEPSAGSVAPKPQELLAACSSTESAAHSFSIFAACNWWTCTNGMCNSVSGMTHNRVRMIDRGTSKGKRFYEYRGRECADPFGEVCGTEFLWAYSCCTQTGTITCKGGSSSGC